VTDPQRTARPAALVEHAWAKVNLTLQVTGRRADGYHELESLVVFAEVGDVIGVAVSGVQSFTLDVDGPFAGGLRGEHDNLVLRAARALAERAGDVPGVAMTLTKNLPVASGIGGGSADAAAALRGLQRLWGLRLPASELATLALHLGADVPVCLRGEPVIMSGIGERLEPVPAVPPLWLVLVNPGVGVSTPAVFKALAGARSTVAEPRLPPADPAGFFAWVAARGNDLEAPACGLAPVIRDVLAALRRLPGCRLARMSGSGATCYGLFENEDAARGAASALADGQESWWVAPARLRPAGRQLP
jgi:4-diphosphocytidyl-2-C-methyl-D-erythritol kinase